MSTSIRVTLPLLVIASGCADVAGRRDQDRSELQQLVRERVEVDVLPVEPDDGSIAPEVRELLQAPLTEDAAVKVAILNNRVVRAGLARLGVASGELVQAGLLSNPILTANAKFFNGGTEIEIGLVQSFVDVFFLSARERIQEFELEATKARIAREIVRLVYEVRRAFVRVHASERRTDAEREILRAAQASADLMGELHRAGNVIDPVLTTDELALVGAKLGVTQAEAAARESRESLSELLGLWDDEVSWTVEGTLSDDVSGGIDLDRVEQRAIVTSLDLAALRAEATAEARRAGIAGWEAVLGPADIGLAAKREVGGSEWGLGPSVGFSLPVFDSGGAKRAVSAAKLEELQALHVVQAVEIRSAARRLRERVRSLADQASFLRTEQLPRATRLVRETLRNYNAMQIGAFEVLVAKQQQVDAVRGYAELLSDAWTARLDLEELLAGSFNPKRIAPEPSDCDHSKAPARQGGH